MNIVKLFEDGIKFEEVETHLHISPDFAQMKLAQRYESGAQEKRLTAEIQVNGNTENFVLNYENYSLDKL